MLLPCGSISKSNADSRGGQGIHTQVLHIKRTTLIKQKSESKGISINGLPFATHRLDCWGWRSCRTYESLVRTSIQHYLSGSYSLVKPFSFASNLLGIKQHTAVICFRSNAITLRWWHRGPTATEGKYGRDKGIVYMKSHKYILNNSNYSV